MPSIFKGKCSFSRSFECTCREFSNSSTFQGIQGLARTLQGTELPELPFPSSTPLLHDLSLRTGEKRSPLLFQDSLHMGKSPRFSWYKPQKLALNCKEIASCFFPFSAPYLRGVSLALLWIWHPKYSIVSLHFLKFSSRPRRDLRSPGA